MRRIARITLTVAATWLSVCAAFGLPASLSSALPAAAAEAPQLRLLAIPPTVTIGDHLDITIEILNPPTAADQLSVAFRFADRLQTRSAFTDARNNKPRAVEVIHTQPANADGKLVASVSPEVASSGRTSNEKIAFKEDGVYPVEIVLFENDKSDPVTRTTTFAIRVSEVTEPLQFAWLWPLHNTPPEKPPTDAQDAAVPEPEATRLAKLAELAAAAPGPITLAPSADTVTRLAQGPSTAALQATGYLRQRTSNEFLTLGYAALSAEAWTGLDQNQLLAQVDRGVTTLEHSLSQPVLHDLRYMPEGPVTKQALLAAQATGSPFVILDADAVDAGRLKTTPTHPFAIAGVETNPPLRVLRNDTALVRNLTGSGGAVQDAQSLLADLTMLYFDSPGSKRGALLAMPLDWDPPTATVREVFRRITTAPTVAFAPVSAFTQIPLLSRKGTPVSVPLTKPNAALDPTPLESYAQVNAAGGTLNLLKTLAVGTDERLDHWTQDVLLAPDVGLIASSDSTSYSAAVVAGVSKALSEVRVEPLEEIRLTSRQSDLPITIRNDSGFTVRLRLELASSTVKFPEGATRDIEAPPEVWNGELAIEIFGGGPHVISLRVTSPDGTYVFAESRIRVHSASINHVAAILSIGSLAFLGIWWLVHHRRRCRAKTATAVTETTNSLPRSAVPVAQ